MNLNFKLRYSIINALTLATHVLLCHLQTFEASNTERSRRLETFPTKLKPFRTFDMSHFGCRDVRRKLTSILWHVALMCQTYCPMSKYQNSNTISKFKVKIFESTIQIMRSAEMI